MWPYGAAADEDMWGGTPAMAATAALAVTDVAMAEDEGDDEEPGGQNHLVQCEQIGYCGSLSHLLKTAMLQTFLWRVPTTALATCTACDMTDSGRRRQQLLQRQEMMGYEVRKNDLLFKYEGCLGSNENIWQFYLFGVKSRGNSGHIINQSPTRLNFCFIILLLEYIFSSLFKGLFSLTSSWTGKYLVGPM